MGFRSINAAFAMQYDPWLVLAFVVGITLPYILLEGGAYIFAAISGSVISRSVVHNTGRLKKFLSYLVIGLLFFTLFYMAYEAFFPRMTVLLKTVLSMSLLLLLVNASRKVFGRGKCQEVFRFHFRLFLFAILLLVLGALLESIVLANSGYLYRIYHSGFIF
jgi:hypothetical protein